MQSLAISSTVDEIYNRVDEIYSQVFKASVQSRNSPRSYAWRLWSTQIDDISLSLFVSVSTSPDILKKNQTPRARSPRS
jgi:hypothetical protein